MIWLLASALAGDAPPTGAALLAKWQQRGAEVILLTPARLVSFGAEYDPNEAAKREDFVIELSLDPAPFCPHIPPFDLWTKVGFFSWAPYLHGCGGPTELVSLAAEGDHVDLVGDVAMPRKGDEPWGPMRVRVTPKSGGTYAVTWRREAPPDSQWSPPITLVEGTESTIRRLIRYRSEAAVPLLAKAGIAAGAKTVRVGESELAVDLAKCVVGQWQCDPAQIAVACPAGASSLLLLNGSTSVHPKLYTWEACTAGVLPGIR